MLHVHRAKFQYPLLQHLHLLAVLQLQGPSFHFDSLLLTLQLVHLQLFCSQGTFQVFCGVSLVLLQHAVPRGEVLVLILQLFTFKLTAARGRRA